MSDEQRNSNNDNRDSSPDPATNEARQGNENGKAVPFANFVNDSLGDMMAENFIEYASYVIKDRAIPDLEDGLKPVQRRILHALNQMDDGRFHKVANVIGNTMQYHPHGDASIGNALVVLANKEYFIEKQGNFGNILTGDDASAPRYIECRLTPLAREVLFNKELTEYAPSYDGRKQEPVTLPAKIPATLLLGADGIAVGMSTRVLPHNFKEVLKAQIAVLKEKSFKLYPDFLTGGIMDASEYDNGNGKIKIRARIEIIDPKTLVIREIPATTTTEGLIASIEEAARRGKIKLAAINDFTTDKPEIEIKLPRGIYAEDTIKRLYAYTNCEISLSTSMVVIRRNRPEILSVEDILRYGTDKLVYLLKRELEIELHKLHDSFHEKTLAQIFIENRIYKRIEEAETFEKVLWEVRNGLEPFANKLKRPITDEDIQKLLEIRIRRISRFDIAKNQKELQEILDQIEKVNHNLDNLISYAVKYLERLLKTYGRQFPRRTKIQELEEISAREVALNNVKIGHDKVNHFVGSDVKNSNKSDEPLACSEYDRLVLLRNNGKVKIIRVPEKEYVGPVKYLFKADNDQVYIIIYRDRKTGKHYIKRFKLDSYIMNREYSTIPKNCIIENVYTNYGMLIRAEFENKNQGTTHIDLEPGQFPLRSRGARGFKISDRKISGFTIAKRGTTTPVRDEDDDTGGKTDGGDSSRDKSEDKTNGETEKAECEEGSLKQVTDRQKTAGSKPRAAKKNGWRGKQNKPATAKSPKNGKKTKTTKPQKTSRRSTPSEPDAPPKAERPAKSKPAGKRLRIDEDTPFFLE